MDKILLPFRQSKLLNSLYVTNIFISLHYALIIYINSSFLSKFFSETQVSSLYLIGSVLDTILLINASKILQKIGNYKFILFAISLELASTILMMLGINAFWVSLSFLVHVFTISLILFNMDVFVEAASPDENTTSSVRATYLTLTNISIVIAPVIVSFLVIEDSYMYVYLMSSLALIPLFFLIKKLKKVKSEKIIHIKIKETLVEYIKNKDLQDVFICQSLLQLFYGYMVIYVPIYLSKYIGFSWSEIGIMFTIMLLPFVLFELPIGEMEDFEYGEKEFLTIGFVIVGLSTMFMSFITVKVFWMWTVILFISRIGASFIEISSESYFFKNVNKDKANVISFFRVSRPISFIVAPLVATLLIGFIPFQYIFIFVGIIMIAGIRYSLALNDTK